MAIARIGTYRLPNRLLSSAKIRLSRAQKQIYLHFAEAEYLRRSQRLGLSREQKQILFASCRSGVSKTKSKIGIKPSAKANLFAFCRGGVSKTKSKIGIKPRAKTNLFVLCRGEVSKTKSKIAIRPRAKANFICVLPQRSTSKTVKAGSVCTRRSALRRRSGEHCVAVVRCARRISTPFAPHRCGTNGKVWPAAESYYFVLILKNRA